MAVTKYITVGILYHTVEIKESYSSGNTTKERYPLNLELLYICVIIPPSKSAKSYHTVCAISKEKYASDSTTQEGHTLLRMLLS